MKKPSKILACIGLYNCHSENGSVLPKELKEARSEAYEEYNELVRLAELGYVVDKATKFGA